VAENKSSTSEVMQETTAQPWEETCTPTMRLRDRFFLCLAFLISIIPIFLYDPGIVVGETVTSRLASVYALIHDGTWYVDRPLTEAPNPYEVRTVDKVQLPNGHMISSKPPVLPFLMAVEYVAMKRGWGLNLDDDAALKPLLTVMILTLIKLPYVVGMLFLALLLKLYTKDGFRAGIALLCAAFAAPILGYAFQINNHTPAAAALCGALYFGFGLYTEKLKASAWRFIAFGFCSAFVFVTDIPTTIFPFLIGLGLLLKFPRKCIVWASVGAAPLLLLHVALMIMITGSPLPVQVRMDVFNFRNSYWRNPIGVDGLDESRLTYLFHMNFGRFGSFVLFPVLLLAFPGAVRMFRNNTAGLRSFVLAMVAAIAALTVYYVLKTDNYGGAAYGFRWHIGMVPVLIFFSLPQILAFRKPIHWFLFLLLVAVSLYSCWECVQAPWGDSHEWTCRLFWGPVL
jgi:hypothetical protein